MPREIVLHLRIRHLIIGTLIGASVLSLLGATAPAPENLRVRHIDIVDTNGDVVMRIGPTADGRNGFFILGPDGEIRAAMQVVGVSGEAGVVVFDEDRSSFVALSAKDVEGDGSSAVTVSSKFGWAALASARKGLLGFSAKRTEPAKGSVMLSVLGTGDAGLSIIDDRGRERGMSPDGDR